MKHLKTYENWIKNILNNLDYNKDRIMHNILRQKLIELGFTSTDMINFKYDSFITSKKIIVKNKYSPAPGLDPGKDIYKVIIIDNNKRNIKWFNDFNKMIKYLDDIIPEYSINRKYNL